MKDKLTELFRKIYGSRDGVSVYFAPGRVNLIGEHTDYNGGHVFPCALTIGTYAAVKVRDDRKIRMYSDNFPQKGMCEIEVGDYGYVEKPDWCNYPVGVIWALYKKGYVLDRGIDIVYYGDIPSGSGLSSSASIEVLTAYFLNEIFGFGIELTDIALLCQYSENKFNGSNCGIMDQFASAKGKAGNAIFLDTATLEYEYAPVKLDGQSLLIINSNKKHSIVNSHYNDRRREAETALSQLQKETDIKSLGELSESEFEEHKHCIENELLVKRSLHAVYENQRTIKAKMALQKNDIKLFGELMAESHVSLRDDYEVSCRELDVIVEEALKLDGVWGIRMTGGGFGGCCVGIFDTDKIDNIKDKIDVVYKERCGIKADFYDVSIGDGPHKL